MAENPRGNIERLAEAGLIITTDPLPDPYVAILKDLDPTLVDALIDLRERLLEAEAEVKSGYGSGSTSIVECFGVPL
jgi:hypothetical protein